MDGTFLNVSHFLHTFSSLKDYLTAMNTIHQWHLYIKRHAKSTRIYWYFFSTKKSIWNLHILLFLFSDGVDDITMLIDIMIY